MAWLTEPGRASVIGASPRLSIFNSNMESLMPKLLRYGHAPGRVREAACDAFNAWIDWDGTGAEPTVEYEIGYVPHRISLSRALGLVWNCTDIVPGSLFDRLQDAMQCKLHSVDPVIKRRTYAACARALLVDIKKEAA
jgi:hypothetical protein